MTLIMRPRRFGKTLTMSMVEQFFSVDYSNRADLFEGLSIWSEERYRMMQGTYPVISLSFANVKESDYKTTREKSTDISPFFSSSIKREDGIPMSFSTHFRSMLYMPPTLYVSKYGRSEE